MALRVGLDVGGTNLAAGLVDENGQIVRRAVGPTAPERGAQAVAEDMVSLCRQVAQGCEIASVGIGVPGLADNARGLIVQTCNIPFDHTPISTMMDCFGGAPTYLCNDANAAAWGEYIAGAGRGVSHMIMLTLGTGIGGGLILDDHLFDGVSGAAGELGHMVIRADGLPCSCGRRGCWEQYASATGLIRLTREQMQAHPDSLLWAEAGGDLSRVEGKTAFRAADSGDVTARRVLEQYIDDVATGLINVVNIFRPERVCIGGGIGHAGERLLIPLRQRLDQVSFLKSAEKTQLVGAQLGNDAGIIGAALLAGQKFPA